MENCMNETKIDWYEERHNLWPNMIFKTIYGDIVKLDRHVPGDGTKWYVATWSNGSWGYYDDTIEPGDLSEIIESPEIDNQIKL